MGVGSLLHGTEATVQRMLLASSPRHMILHRMNFPPSRLLCCRHTVVRGSAICDPDGILAPETANKLEELIDAARKDISIPIAAFGLRYAPTLCPPLQIALFRAHARGKHTHSKTEVSNPGGERRAVQIAVLVINKMGVGPGGRRPSSAEFAKQGIACAPKSGPAPPSWPCVERSCS